MHIDAGADLNDRGCRRHDKDVFGTEGGPDNAHDGRNNNGHNMVDTLAHGQSFCNLVGADGQRAHQIGVDHIDLIHHHGDDVEDTGNEHHDPCLRQESVFEAFGKKGQH